VCVRKFYLEQTPVLFSSTAVQLSVCSFECMSINPSSDQAGRFGRFSNHRPAGVSSSTVCVPGNMAVAAHLSCLLCCGVIWTGSV
jgi:hypothetical protein